MVKQRSITLTSNVWKGISNVWKGISNDVVVNKEEDVPYMKENNNKEIYNKIISYDTDGVMLWNCKRCELVPPTKDEQKEMEDLLSEFK